MYDWAKIPIEISKPCAFLKIKFLIVSFLFFRNNTTHLNYVLVGFFPVQSQGIPYIWKAGKLPSQVQEERLSLGLHAWSRSPCLLAQDPVLFFN